VAGGLPVEALDLYRGSRDGLAAHYLPVWLRVGAEATATRCLHRRVARTGVK
jgi:hypothetical protein